MKTWLIGIGVALATAALGVGAAYGASQLVKTYAADAIETGRMVRANLPAQQDGWRAVGRTGRMSSAMGGGMPQGLRDRIRDWRAGRNEAPIDAAQAARLAAEFAADLGDNLRVSEVMEFDRNFYAVIVEKDTGRGAAEILIDKYGGDVTFEPGPARMWNLKYGPGCLLDGAAGATDNTLTLAEARQAAADYLAKNMPGATLAEGGIAFYGYYTFDYVVDGKTAGMLSVNGLSGQTWLHTWHGGFVSELEVD